ncbi:hypothetical protein KC19_4G227800 [Ceratodon purpureus]|uniref:Uncharacterized protein n=1 Tax=Ceratodon purpureus TaxID=3225 RepID=A0A8T0IBN0_CERPU|nr:hypothetical protein KC19_4G227800 [Ceratodon purpureus]
MSSMALASTILVLSPCLRRHPRLKLHQRSTFVTLQPIHISAESMPVFAAEVCLLTVFEGHQTTARCRCTCARCDNQAACRQERNLQA